MSSQEDRRLAELAWDLADYQRYGEEPPPRIVSSPEACEGELMSDEEVEAYIKDGLATLLILSERQSDRVNTVQEAFVADLLFLVSLGRLSVDDYNDITTNLDTKD